MKRLLIIGAGRQAEAVAYDALKFGWADQVTVADINLQFAEDLKGRLGDDPRVIPVQLNAGDTSAVEGLMAEHEVAVGAADYSLNFGLSCAAVNTKTHFCDMGGNNTVVRKQFALSEKAAECEVKIVPDCGIAPGAVSPLSVYAMGLLGRTPKYLRIRVGGLPQKPEGELGYTLVFAPRGWTNEILEPAVILRGGKVEEVRSMTGFEEVTTFPSPFDDLEAVYTSGGSSTLTDTYAGKIPELNYKTLRYPGHWEKMILLKKLGFLSELDAELPGGRKANPREVAEAVFNRTLPHNARDALLMSIEAGDDDGMARLIMVDLYNESTGHTAMQRTTGYCTAIIAEMLMNGTISDCGTLYQERSVRADWFFMEMKKRRITIEVQFEGTTDSRYRVLVP